MKTIIYNDGWVGLPIGRIEGPNTIGGAGAFRLLLKG